MTAKTSIRIPLDLYERARQHAALEHRTITGQIEFWARLGCAALTSSARPANLPATAISSLAETVESGRTDQEYEQLLNRIEDLEDCMLAKERAGGPFVEVSWDEL